MARPTMPEPSPSNPFRYRLFALLWAGTTLSNIGLWMQNVGAAWLMATLTPSIFMIALVQAATTAPTFLIGLPAGVLADLMDRRRLLLVAQVGMFACAGTLAIASWLSVLTPWTLLMLTFALGACSALSSTVRQASVSDVVPRVAMVSALGFSGIGYNSARAVGPALAGVLLVWQGASAVFVAAACLFAAALGIQLMGYDPPPQEPSTESPRAAMRSGLRYVRHARPLHAFMLRTIVFVGAASSLWALLPVVARDHPSFGASGYAILLGFMGAGAVVSGFLLGWLRARCSLDSMATAAGYVFAGAIFAAALVAWLPLLCVALFAGGTAWVLNNSSINAAYQTSLPSWVRARALSVRLLVFQGTMAIGSVLWGAVASHFGVVFALCMAGALTLAGLLVTSRRPIKLGREDDFVPSGHWVDTAVVDEPAPDDGPIAIEVTYYISPVRRAEFIASIEALGVLRRRDGARHWRLYRDLSEQDCYAERFVVESWGEFQRQRERATMADASSERLVRSFHIGRAPVRVAHFMAITN